MRNCIFCKIVRGDISSKIIYQDDYLIVFSDINPASKTHLLIVPKKHISSFIEIKKKDYRLINNMVKIAQKFIQTKRINKKYKLVINGGDFQFVPHLHMHLLGGEIKKQI